MTDNTDNKDNKDKGGGLTYRDAGVDIDAGNALVEAIGPLAESTRRSGVMTGLGGFGGLFDLKATGYRDPVLVAANDGVGTKLKIAIETGQHETIGIDLVAMCVNDLVVQGAEPLFFLDYFAVGKLDGEVAAAVIGGIAEGCRQAGCALIGGETAEMPGLYARDDYDLAGFAVGAVERDALLPRREALRPGDILLGLAASGAHANGFSLIRRIVAQAGLDWDAPLPGAGDTAMTLGRFFLTPTRIYVQPLLEALRRSAGIKALAHITGGGFWENIPRVLPEELAAQIDLAVLSEKGEVPQTVRAGFDWLMRSGQVAPFEMLRTFNCGIGMVLVVAEEAVAEIRAVLQRNGAPAVVLGRVTARDGDAAVSYVGNLAFGG